MKYITIATTEYGKGRIILFPSRFNNTNTACNLLNPELTRSMLEWVSQRNENDRISALSVSHESVEGNLFNVAEVEDVSMSFGELDDLSVSSSLPSRDCIIFNGIDNNISPLIRSNLTNYVVGGGGLVLCDLRVNGEAVELLESVAPVTVQSSGVNISGGYPIWTDEGREHPIFRDRFLGVDITLLNTVKTTAVSSAWDVLNIVDTDVEVREGDLEIDELLFTRSQDVSVPGSFFVGYYATVYEDGITDLETEE